jgi:hypothetical protein
MRDIGYSLETAIADVIDNSIYARAGSVKILATWNSEHSSISICDDGEGMGRECLIEAMRLGTIGPTAERDDADLGRFGLGLKTASFSQCRSLSVVSSNGDEMTGCRWDLDRIVDTDEWTLELLTADEISALPGSETVDSPGTLVVWEKLDRVVDFTDTKSTEKNFNSAIVEAIDHLALVFHRYLKGEPGIKKFAIDVNGVPIEPFDPFNSTTEATQRLHEEVVVIGGEKVLIQPFILPHHSKTSGAEYKKYAGSNGYLKNQGFYVYRNARLLTSGTWFKLARQEELTKLARVRIDLPNSLDHYWKIDVKKSRATPPEIVRRRLKRIIEKISGSAKRVYKGRGKRLKDKVDKPVWARHVNKGTLSYTIDPEHPLLEGFASDLPEAQRNRFNGILRLIESSFPVATFYSDVAQDPESVVSATPDNDELSAFAELYYDYCRMSTDDHKVIREAFLGADPFSGHPKFVDDFLNSKSAGE